MILRRLAERLSRGVILRRHLPKEFGSLPLCVSPEAGLRYWRWDLGAVDPLLFRMARELVRPGHVIWDVGANVGLFGFSAAALAGPSGRVLAVEPDLWLAHLLTLSARRMPPHASRVAPVEVLCTAVSDTNRISRLQIAERARAANYLAEAAGSSQAGGCRYQQPTVTLSLDFLLDYFPAPSVLKIDVEAAEVHVLNGAAKLLGSVRPVIWCEVALENSQAVTELLHRNHYELYPAAVDAAQRTTVNQAPWDTLAIPKTQR